MRKRVSFCVLSVLFSCSSSVLFSQVTEIAMLSSNDFTAALQYNLMESPEGLALLQINQDYNAIPSSDEDCAAEAAEAATTLAMQTAITNFFSAMESGKIDQLQATCIKGVQFKTHLQDQNGNHYIFDESMKDLIPFVAKSGNCFNIDVQYELLPPDPSTMQFRAPYVLYLNDQVSHCGVCTFELEKEGDDWKIKQMVDTRSRSCK